MSCKISNPCGPIRKEQQTFAEITLSISGSEARDEMIWAVNSLPEKGRKVHQRTVVAKLQTSPQDATATTCSVYSCAAVASVASVALEALA